VDRSVKKGFIFENFFLLFFTEIHGSRPLFRGNNILKD